MLGLAGHEAVAQADDLPSAVAAEEMVRALPGVTVSADSVALAEAS